LAQLNEQTRQSWRNVRHIATGACDPSQRSSQSEYAIS
jgi:hypothetical protein